MNIVITMAGNGERFLRAGFNLPKYMLSARQRTLFSWSLESLRNFFSYQFIFVTLARNNSDAFIEKEAKDLGISSIIIKNINQPTDGQASSVIMAADTLSYPEPILIYNIDTYVNPEHLHPEDIKGDGWIPCFDCQGDHFSFVEFDSNYRVERIAEKNRISPFGTIGLYYFSSFQLFIDSYHTCSFDGIKEKFVAPLYSSLLEKNKDVYAAPVPSCDVHILGTPTEVLRFDPSFGHESVITQQKGLIS
jgi:dTDP-glucose pyrophosphorylase